MIVPAAAAVLVLVELHLVVPSVVWRLRQFGMDRIYDGLTMLVAALAAVPALAAGWPTGRSGSRPSSADPPPPAVRIVSVATAEELLWRVRAPAAGQAGGWHPAV